MADDGYLQGFGLEAVAALIMFQMWIVCTQITINLGGSLQLPAEAALLCKDWLAIRAPGCGLRRTESANPAGVILIKCCLCRRMTRTLLPPCVVRRCLVRPITVPPLTVSPFKEPIGTPVVFQSPPPSSIFSSDHRRIIVINILSKNWQHSAVPVCRHSGQSVNLQKAIDFDLCVCIQQLELSSTWNPIQIIAHVNYTYFALYQTRRCHRTQHICPPGKEIGFSVNKNLLFPCYTVFVFPSFLVLRVLFVSRIPILVTFEQPKTLPTPESLAPSKLGGHKQGGGQNKFMTVFGGVTAVGTADHAICATSQKYGWYGFADYSD